MFASRVWNRIIDDGGVFSNIPRDIEAGLYKYPHVSESCHTIQSAGNVHSCRRIYTRIKERDQVCEISFLLYEMEEVRQIYVWISTPTSRMNFISIWLWIWKIRLDFRLFSVWILRIIHSNQLHIPVKIIQCVFLPFINIKQKQRYNIYVYTTMAAFMITFQMLAM